MHNIFQIQETESASTKSAAATAAGNITSPARTPTSTATPHIPIAKVNTVDPSSPASLSGLTPGDKIVRFGTLTQTDETKAFDLRLLAGQVVEGREVPVDVMRNGVIVNLRLTPMKWSGRGLLGCHIVQYS